MMFDLSVVSETIVMGILFIININCEVQNGETHPTHLRASVNNTQIRC
jgi:hypothetical protein